MTNKREVLSFLTGEGQNSRDFLQLCGAPAPVTPAANSLSTGNRQETPTMQIRVPMFIVSPESEPSKASLCAVPGELGVLISQITVINF